MLNQLSEASGSSDFQGTIRAQAGGGDGQSSVDAAVKDAWSSLSQQRNNFSESLAVSEAMLPSLILGNDRGYSPEPALTYRQTTDGLGHQTTVGYAGGVARFCQDTSGEWDSADGRNWIQRGTNGRSIWHGSATIDGAGTYTAVNSDSGVTGVYRRDGTTSRSFTGAGGRQIEVKTNAQGINVRCTDSTGSWTSSDGQNWTNTVNGQRSKFTVQVDQFGQYIVKPEGRPECVEGISGELAAVIERQKQLSKDYGITFSEPGLKKDYDGKHLIMRPPTMEELDCVSDVLQQNRQMNLSGLKLSFVQSGRALDNYDLWGVYFDASTGGGREMVLFPRNTQIRGWSALEGTLQHELVHHEQSTSWGDGGWGAMGSNKQTRQLLVDFGWVHDKTSGLDNLLDQGGGQWQLNKGKWAPVISGHPEPGRAITNQEMRARAQVRPATDYFTHPWEMHAEALAMFRHDRRQLWGDNPQLYQLMQQYDQREIDRNLGSENGQACFIRGVDGKIVANTPQNRNAVTEMENSWQDMPLSRRQDYAQRSYCCGRCQA